MSSVRSIPAQFKLAFPSNSRRTDSDGAGKLQLQGEGRVGGVKLAVTGGQLQNLHVEVIILMDFSLPRLMMIISSDLGMGVEVIELQILQRPAESLHRAAALS